MVDKPVIAVPAFSMLMQSIHLPIGLIEGLATGAIIAVSKVVDTKKTENGRNKDFGFECCRLRMHGETARIEILPKKSDDFLQNREKITDRPRELGIKYVTLDLEDFRRGSMDI